MLICISTMRGLSIRNSSFQVRQSMRCSCYILRQLKGDMTRKRPDKWRKNNWVHHHDNASTHTALTVHQFLSSKNVTDLTLGFSICLRCATRQCGASWLVSGRLGIPGLFISVVVQFCYLKSILPSSLLLRWTLAAVFCTRNNLCIFSVARLCYKLLRLNSSKNFYFHNFCYCIRLS